MPDQQRQTPPAATRTVEALRDSLYEHDLCPECVGPLDEYGDCLDCGHDAYLEVRERYADDL